MTVMESFTPIASTIGGVLIGIAAAGLLMFHGRIAGISGIAGGIFRQREQGDTAWRVMFLVGLFAAADVGRVYLDEDPGDADEWHTAVGGGLWLSFIDRLSTLSVAIMDGDDVTGVYLRSGFLY